MLIGRRLLLAACNPILFYGFSFSFFLIFSFLFAGSRTPTGPSSSSRSVARPSSGTGLPTRCVRHMRPRHACLNPHAILHELWSRRLSLFRADFEACQSYRIVANRLAVSLSRCLAVSPSRCLVLSRCLVVRSLFAVSYCLVLSRVVSYCLVLSRCLAVSLSRCLAVSLSYRTVLSVFFIFYCLLLLARLSTALVHSISVSQVQPQD